MSVTTSPSAGGNAVSSGGNASIPAPVEQVNLTIDGVPVAVPKNTLVIRAAEEVGVQIPRFCDHPLLEPVGACRQCLVEIATPGPDGSLRPTAADLLVAGRVVDELAELGIDFHSPACAAACAAAVALRGATETLVAADAAAIQSSTDHRAGADR